MTEDAWGKKLWDYRKNLGVSRKKFAELLGINEGTLRSYETEQRKPGYETYKKIEEYINTRDKVKESELSMNQQNRLIEYQEKELIQLREENERLKKSKDNYLENEIGTDYQFSLDVKFNFRPSHFAVDIMYVKALTSFDYIVKKLGYSKNELYDIFSFGKYINYKDHTIHQLRSKDQKARMLQKASNIIRSMLFSKDEMAAYNLKLPIIYLSKNGKKVHAINQFLVNWEEKTAVVNIHFMNGCC